MKYFLSRLKDLHLSDLCGGAKFLIAIIPSLIYKSYLSVLHQSYWLICEEKNEAQDNGWCFFQYMNEKHPEQRTVYAIGKHSPVYEKVKECGKTVYYGTIKHWILYLCAEINISSQKGGKPNPAVCYILEVYGLLKNRRVFLQHGVIMNNCEYLHYSKTKMWMFICSSNTEREYVETVFQYPKDIVICTGLSRFDYLQNEITEKIILLIPSWRTWLALPSKVDLSTQKESEYFQDSEYFYAYNSFLHNEKLISILNEYNYKLIFYPHRSMQKYISYFSSNSERVILADANHYNIQDLLKKSSIMITDYSSIAFDFAYLEKPIIYYQFDLSRFRKYQYEEGYFNYQRDGFGPVCSDEGNLVSELLKVVKGDSDDTYLKKEKKFFTYHDKSNSERIFQEIKRKIVS